jgi:adenylosuccinate lyase
MKRIWSDEDKFDKWLEVEIAVCDAWAEIGVIPKKAIPRIKLAKCNLRRMEEILSGHIMICRLPGSVAESVGEEARFIHLGLTSSDVMDTALSLQMVEASTILAQDIKELIQVLARKAIEYKYTVMMGRTHGIHAEPISFGLKLALWTAEIGVT